jgi:enoyl-CoA hydratase
MVHGACVAGGLSLAWACDLIVAAEDAYFADPVVRMGIPGIEYFAHVHTLTARLAKEMLFLGDRVPAPRAYEMGMINRVVADGELRQETARVAGRIADKPAFALALAKQAVNQAEDAMGLRTAMDASFGLHQIGHLHNATSGEDHIGGMDPQKMSDAME